MKSIALVLTLFAANAVSAREQAVKSCDQAPLLATVQERLPDHVLARNAEIKPRLASALPADLSVPILTRARANLVCVIIALDATGTPEGAVVTYPTNFTLSDRELRRILAVRWSPAEVGGQARPSLVNMDFAWR